MKIWQACLPLLLLAGGCDFRPGPKPAAASQAGATTTVPAGACKITLAVSGMT